MANYKLSNAAKGDLIRIHHFGVHKFGMTQTDKYFDTFYSVKNYCWQQSRFQIFRMD